MKNKIIGYNICFCAIIVGMVLGVPLFIAWALLSLPSEALALLAHVLGKAADKIGNLRLAVFREILKPMLDESERLFRG